jgi:hypothetical protein
MASINHYYSFKYDVFEPAHFDPETIGLGSIIGAVGIIIGVIIATIGPKKREND